MKTIKLTNNALCQVSDKDYSRLRKFTWMQNNYGYVYRKEYVGVVNGKYKYITHLLHRQLLRLGHGGAVDHINGDKLDNRRSNLRICTNQENVRNAKRPKTNTSGYKGVTWDKARSKWVAYIYHGKSINLGGFDKKEEAAYAYDNAARKLFGAFARTNF